MAAKAFSMVGKPTVNLFDQTQGLLRRRIPHLSKNSERKKTPHLFFGRCILILILAEGGYFLFYGSEGCLFLKQGNLPLNKKAIPDLESPAFASAPSFPEKKVISDPLLTKSEQISSSLLSEKSDPVQGGNKEEKLHAKQEKGSPQPIGGQARSETEKPETAKPEAKKSEVPKSLHGTSSHPTGASRHVPSFEGQFAVLVGSFKSKDNALALRQKLQNKGYPVANYPIEFPGKGGVWYRVIVGNYKDAQDAKKVASELKAKEKVPALLMKGYKFI
jgi:cell division septation protein DedD